VESEQNEQRWIVLLSTSPSGKTLFVCKVCGCKSIAPDKDCPVRPTFGTGSNYEDARSGLSCREVWATKDDPEYTEARSVLREYKLRQDELQDQLTQRIEEIRGLEHKLYELKHSAPKNELEKLADQVAGVLQRRWVEQTQSFAEMGLSKSPAFPEEVGRDIREG
jgi:hypothetical protein